MNISQNGNGDDFFLAWVRRLLRDQTPYVQYTTGCDGTQGTITPGSKPFKVDYPPVLRGSVKIDAPGGPWVPVYDVEPLSGQVEVVTDTGELIFASAPTTGNLSVSYRTSRFSDREILDALRTGLTQMYPELWQELQDPPPPEFSSATALIFNANQWEYELPQFLQNPHTVILSMEFFPPQGWVRWYEKRDWQRVGLNAIKFNDLETPGSVMRFTYTGPYQALGEVEPEAMHLPVYYAVGTLMMQRETMRTAQDQLVPLTAEGASAPGSAANVASVWMNQFAEDKKRLQRPVPMRGTVALPVQ